MATAKRLLLFSQHDPNAAALQRATAGWGHQVRACASLDELRGELDGAEHDVVVVEPSTALRALCQAEPTDDAVRLSLAEVEKRHLHRVLAATGGNKTQAARILGIDTKTLYNRIKSYETSALMARRRLGPAGATPSD